MHQRKLKNGVINIYSDADNSVFEEIFVEREYSQLVPIIEKAKNCIIDIGAHTGMFSIYARNINGQVPIYAFEPEETNFGRLKENLALNHCKVTAKNQAVSDKVESVDLYIHPDSHNHSLIDKSDQTKKVNSTTLDAIFRKFQIEKCDLLKVDCEGGEYLIFADTSPETMTRISNIYIEYHEYDQFLNNKSIQEQLKHFGFKVEAKTSHYSKDLGFIFAHK